MIDKDGKVVIADISDNAEVEYETLPNGKITPKQLPGSIKYIPITKDETTLRRNFKVSNNSDIGDGDLNSSRFYQDDEDQFSARPSMYNSPQKPTREIDPDTGLVCLFCQSSPLSPASRRAAVRWPHKTPGGRISQKSQGHHTWV